MEIQLKTTDGKTGYKATAFRTAVPELVVHRRLSRFGVPLKGCWDVTHVPTGLKLTAFPIVNRALAKAFANELTHLDWSFDSSNIPTGEAFKLYGKAVVAARKSVNVDNILLSGI